jgi:hypothetical protein
MSSTATPAWSNAEWNISNSCRTPAFPGARPGTCSCSTKSSETSSSTAVRSPALIRWKNWRVQIVDQQLPALHAVIAQALSTLAEDDREHLLTSLTTIRARVSQIASQPLPPAKARRRRRADNTDRSAP